MKEITYHIIFRTCDIVHSLHNAPRPFGLDKRTLIKICFLSLYKSVSQFPHSFYILGDKLSDDMLQFFAQFPVTVSNEDLGNDKSIRRSIEQACIQEQDTWVYLCEDDYLHHPDAFLWINDLVVNRNQYIVQESPSRFSKGNRLENIPIVIHPPDYPDRYLPSYVQPSLIFTSQLCHWRQVSSTTYTFLADVSTFKKYRKILDKSSIGADDRFMSKKMFAQQQFAGKTLCLSPIPGIATHMHEEVMTPLVKWEEIYKNLLHDLEGQK